MGGSRKPGATGTSDEPQLLNAGVTKRAGHSRPGPIGLDDDSVESNLCEGPTSFELYISPFLRDTVQIVDTIAPTLTWNAFWRKAYEQADRLLQAQADQLLKRGDITRQEFDELVKARNRLVVEFRKPLSPLGQRFSEIMKPASQLPQPDELLAKKGTIEAVLESVGKSRASVNRVSMVLQKAASAMIVLDLVVTTVVVMQAPPEQRCRTAAREYTGMVAGAIGAWRGTSLGCSTALEFGSPFLPKAPTGALVGAIALCGVGGVLGGLGVGWLSREGGKAVGEAGYDFVTNFRWE